MATCPAAAEPLAEAAPVVPGVPLVLLELHAATSRPAAATAVAPARRLFDLMALLTEL
jgi:hypothetical protein